MAKQSSRVRNEIQGEGRRINSESDQLMQLLYGRLGRTGEGNKNPVFNELMSGYRGISGGSSPRPDFGKYEAGFGEAARTGLLDAENKRRIRGDGVFDEYSKTGGYSDADKQNIRSRATRTVPAFFDAMRTKMNQQAAITGGGPSFNSSLARMAREESRGAAEATQDAELGIMDRVNEGRRWGTEGMSGAETRLADMISRNKLAGLQGGLGAAQAGGDFDLKNRGLNLEAELGKLGGMAGLYGADKGEEMDLLRMIMGGYGQRGQLAGGNIGQRASYDPNVSWFDRFMRIWGQGANNMKTAVGGPLY